MKVKSEIRKKYINKRKDYDKNTSSKASDIICDKLINSDIYRDNDYIYVYVDTNNEVSTAKIINHALEAEKIVSCPKVEGEYMQFYRIHSINELSHGKFGILEPTGNNIIENAGLVIVPGVAFDTECKRIGYGGGYYDKYLEKHQFKTVALAYEIQITDCIPAEPTDKKMDMIITEKNIYTNRF